ncbi:hypothetical protein Tmar_0494 [Thermaerobacter marianensis DSM 12885]|uniref:EfeO-type cupredoxin-like domain-containing protein n=1 Tax=Thermaerobacter marianensis (strain ATCC 700841 / DSM 12885 / JCM 10246 / 7p75a) TaxID=644966 RepID=E6SGY4_THEM7|nr:hypothetical protein [Thermaerobacter marianensis]ADU50615.1 hypothetical protein Tmar_0494 [Thermaerobacter marianensis DSM 12885]
MVGGSKNTAHPPGPVDPARHQPSNGPFSRSRLSRSSRSSRGSRRGDRRFCRSRRAVVLAVLVLAALALTACGQGEDRPGTVSVDPESGTVSGSGTGTGTGTGTGSASGTHAGAEAGRVEPKPAGATQVNVTLKEWAIEVEPAQVKAGRVYFLVTNAGPERPHELVIVRSDAEPEQLPVADGRVREDQVEMVGEVEAFAAGTRASGLFDLEPGRYLLICNIVEGEGDQATSHFAEGMVAELTVTP